MKKNRALYPLFLASLFSIGCYLLFFSTTPVTPNHAALPLTPNTLREQNDLILAQEQEEQPMQTGPLVAQMGAEAAQAKALNLKNVQNTPSPT